MPGWDHSAPIILPLLDGQECPSYLSIEDCLTLRRLIAFRFEIVRDKLRISGVPNYHFARATPAGQFQELKTLNRNCRQNRRLFTDINPIVYKTIDDFSKLVAFFNYIDETNPAELDAFIADLKPVLDRIPTMDTPIALTMPAR